MRDIFSEGLLYLDLLEVYGSSHVVGEICGISQSNVYRGAQSCAKILNLGLQKEGGTYRVERNLDVQLDLRRVAQRMRAREAGSLRFVGDSWLPRVQLEADRSLFHILPKRWLSLQRSIDFLANGVLDLVICRFQDLRGWLPLSAEPLPLNRPLSSQHLGLFALTTDPIQLFVRDGHPLLVRENITASDLSQFSSPALNSKLVPGLAACFEPLGLWNNRLNVRFLSDGLWEQQALISDQIVPSTLRSIALAKQHNPKLELRALPFETGLKEQDVLLVPMDLVKEPLLQKSVRQILSVYAKLQVNALVPSP